MNEDTQKLIGTILNENAQRDAIHIAVVPLIAGEDLHRGAPIGLAYGTKDTAKYREKYYGWKPIGIVDPFIADYRVKKGQRFFCFLYPGTVTGMRHNFRHPAFDEPLPTPANESELWLHQFAEKWNFHYDEMIAGAQEEEGYVVANGIDLHSRTELDPGEEDLFWSHIERLTGKIFDQNHRENFGWSCSC